MSSTAEQALVQVLSRAMRAGTDSLQGWQVLSHLQFQNEQFDLAADSAAQGLKLLAQRHKRGHQDPSDVAAAILLTRGHSLLSLQQTDDALAVFKALTGSFTAQFEAIHPFCCCCCHPAVDSAAHGLKIVSSAPQAWPSRPICCCCCHPVDQRAQLALLAANRRTGCVQGPHRFVALKSWRQSVPSAVVAAILLTRGHSLLALQRTEDALAVFKALIGLLHRTIGM